MKKLLLTLLQVGVTVSVLFLVFRDPQKNAQMVAAVRAADPRWFLAALVVSAVPVLTATTRWALLLRVQGFNLGWFYALRLFLIGAFFNLFLLGSTGGDAVKIFYLLRDAPDRKAAGVLTIVMDRVIGLTALIVLAALFIGARFGWLTRTPTAAHYVYIVVAILGSAVLGIVVTAFALALNLAGRVPAGLPGRVKFLEMDAMVKTYANSWGAVVAAFFISMLGHFSLITAFYCASRALRIAASFWDLVAVLPVINTIVSMPISVSGVGVREGLFKQLLADLCAVPESQSVPLSVIGFIFTMLVPGMVGGILYLFHRTAAGAVPGSAELERLEQDATATAVAPAAGLPTPRRADG